MKTLHLNLHVKWFDMILSGEKKEEYREIKPYFQKKLLDKEWQRFHRFSTDKCLYYKQKYIEGYYAGNECSLGILLNNNCNFNCHNFEFDTIDIYKKIKFNYIKTITFSNGNSKNRKQFVIELLSIRVDNGKSEWGAVENKKYFVLQLGNVISSSCC